MIMDEVVIDACCLINLYAAGYPRIEPLLHGRTWYVPSVVVCESLYIHQTQLDGMNLKIAIEIQSLIDEGSIHSCEATDGAELDLFVDFATSKIDDGEAMALAIAKSRGWTIATDDRKAIRLAGALDLCTHDPRFDEELVGRFSPISRSVAAGP